MPFDGVSYGASAWGSGTVVGQDCLTYTVLIDHAQGAEVTTTLTVVDCRVRWSVEQSGEGAASCLSGLMPSTVTLTLVDLHRGMFSALSEGSDGEWRLRIKQGSDLYWLGYIVPRGLDENPYAAPPTVTLTFADGFGLLEGRAAELGEDDESIISRLGGILWPLGACEAGGPGDGNDLLADSWSGLTTAVDWRPYRRGTQIDYDDDPTACVIVPNRAFTDADGVATNQRRVLEALAERMGARLLQSDGRWWFVPREALAQDAANVRTFAYDRAFSPTAATASLVTDVRITEASRHIAGPSTTRGIPVPVRKVTSTYDFEPDGRSLLLNGSFESAGYLTGLTAGAPATSARYWDLTANATFAPERQDISLDAEYGMDPADGSVWILKTPGSHASEGDRHATQYGFVYLRAEVGSRCEFSYAATLEDDATGRWGSGWGAVGKARLGLCDAQGTLLYGVHRFTLEVTGTAWPGDNVRIYCKPVLDGVSGAISGVEVLPAGATVQIYRPLDGTGSEGPLGTITLTERLRIGDHQLRGDFTIESTDSDHVKAEDEDSIFVYYWTTGTPSTDGETDKNIFVEDTSGDFEDTFFRGSNTVGAYDVTGALVEGHPWCRLYGPDNTDPGDLDEIRQYWDDVVWTYVPAGGEGGKLVYTAEMYEGAPGVTVPLPLSGAHPAGDGPTVETETALVSTLADGSAEESTATGHGHPTSWIRGIHTGTPEEQTSIDELLSDGALRMIGGAVERWEAVFHLRDSLTLYPHLVPLVHQVSGLAPPPTSGTHADANDSGQAWIRMYQRPEVGRNVIIAPGTASVETKVVADFYPWFNSWVVELTSNLTNSHATGTAVLYEMLLWPDVFEHDLIAGSYVVSGTRLQWIPYEVPGPPEELVGVAEDGAVEWTWTAVPGATHYRIEWGTTSGGPYTAHAVVEDPTVTYTSTGLVNGTTYYGVARAGIEYGGTGTSAGGFLLLENDDNILLESGDDLLLG